MARPFLTRFTSSAYFNRAYDTGFYPIIGLNRPSLEFGWGFTYFDKNSKLQINGAVGFMASMENYATHIKRGRIPAQWAIGYKFDNGLLIGAVGYDYRQVTGDSGPPPFLALLRAWGTRSGPASAITLSAGCPWSSTFAITNSTIGRTSSTGTRPLPRSRRSSRPLRRWTLRPRA